MIGMKSDVFEAVRSSVSAKQAAELYGLQFDRAGRKAICPWHADKHPSLSFKGQGCKCFACNAGGSAIDLTMHLFGLDAKGAAAKLNADFRLGLDMNAPVPAFTIRQAQQDKQLAASLDAWLNRAHDTLARRYRQLRAQQEAHQPTDPDAPFPAQWFEACRAIDYVGFLLDEAEKAREPADKVRFFKFYREGVERYERELHADRRTVAD